MGEGPQYNSQYEKSVHNKLVQYGKGSTIYWSIRKCPQYISSIWKRVHNILFNVEKIPQYISQYGKVSTIN